MTKFSSTAGGTIFLNSYNQIIKALSEVSLAATNIYEFITWDFTDIILVKLQQVQI